MVGDLQRDVGRAGERLTEGEVVVVLLQLRDRRLVRLCVLTRKRYQALAEPLGPGGGARGRAPPRLGPEATNSPSRRSRYGSIISRRRRRTASRPTTSRRPARRSSGC